jgi:putative acetyltransferase
MKALLPSGVSVREATNSDKEAVLSLMRDIYREYGLLLTSDLTADLQDLENSYAKGYFGLLRRSDIIIGSYGLFPLAEKTGEIRKMYLIPQARGMGLGKWMLRTLLDIANEKGFQTLELETSSNFTEAIGLYQRFGFSEIDYIGKSPACDRRFALELNHD